MAEVSICYGMTETSPVSLQTRRDDDLEHRTGTVGLVLPHLEVKVVDPADGATQPRGTAGKAVHPRLQRDARLLERAREDRRGRRRGALDADGDLAVMREDGYVEIVGRIKDMIIRGGENIYPREIEEFLYAHPKIADVQVVGVPDERYGEEVLACVIPLDPADPLTLEELRAFCEGRLAGDPRAACRSVFFPMTVSGRSARSNCGRPTPNRALPAAGFRPRWRGVRRRGCSPAGGCP